MGNKKRCKRRKGKKMMLDCGGCLCSSNNSVVESPLLQPHSFPLPSPLPQSPQEGEGGFAKGIISLGEVEVAKITKFEFIWGIKDTLFYKPTSIPHGFSPLGHFCHPHILPFRGYILVAREGTPSPSAPLPALRIPTDYTLVWTEGSAHSAHFWAPDPPAGYRALGLLVTPTLTKPDLHEIRCVRSDLTDECEHHKIILDIFDLRPLRVWCTRPCSRGMSGRGVPVGTFFCSITSTKTTPWCLNNLDARLHSMPDLGQIHTLIEHYGPTVFFHPDELYLPSSVSWFFKNGAVLCKKGELSREYIDQFGSNLPSGGSNDGLYWIDLPSNNDDDDDADDDNADNDNGDGGDKGDGIKRGNMENAVVYVHVKAALGGTFTDVVMWVFYPFNGPARVKVGALTFGLGTIGRHVGDWEHFTLRVSNFTGGLWSVYFSQHSGGVWVDASELEYVRGNRCAVYSSLGGHASFPCPGEYVQGLKRLGVGIRNEAAGGGRTLDSGLRYEIVAAEYLGEGVVKEPPWLHFMRGWGPRVVYDWRRVVGPGVVSNFLERLPVEIFGEEGPTGPREKNNWSGDERW